MAHLGIVQIPTLDDLYGGFHVGTPNTLDGFMENPAKMDDDWFTELKDGDFPFRYVKLRVAMVILEVEVGKS